MALCCVGLEPEGLQELRGLRRRRRAMRRGPFGGGRFVVSWKGDRIAFIFGKLKATRK